MRRQTHGTLLKLGDGAASNEVFTTVAQVIEIKPPSRTRTTKELADHDMTTNKRYVGDKLLDLPPMPGRIYYDPQNATHVALYEALSDGESHNWQVVLPGDGGMWEISGILTAVDADPAPASDGMLEANIEIQPDGETFIAPEDA